MRCTSYRAGRGSPWAESSGPGAPGARATLPLAMTPSQDDLDLAKQDRDEMNFVLDAGRDALAQEFQVAERLDSKARGQMTFAGAWFAIVQAVAGVALRDPLSTGWSAAVVGSAATAAVALAWCFYRHHEVWKLRPETGFNSDAIHAFGEWAADKHTDLAGTLVGYYERILRERQKQNSARATAFDEAGGAWFLAIGLTLIELMVALVAAVTG